MYIKFIFLFLLLFILYIIFKIINKKKSDIRYFKCKLDDGKTHFTKILKNTLMVNKIKKSSFKKSNLYLPCKYTTVENELKSYSFDNNKIIFSINGCDNVVSKAKLWTIISSKYGRRKASKIMPETFLTDSDINEFKKRYKKNKLYILKNKLQRKEGIYLTKDYNFLINSEKNGYTIIQDYIKNVFLINNRKLNIRIYTVIICYKNIFNCYIYNNGKCIYTNSDYNYKSKDLHSHITSLDLDLKIYEKNPLTLHELKSYMIKNKLNYDKLWTNVNKCIKKATHAFKKYLYTDEKFKNNLSFQIFGPDIIVDEKLNCFIAEINKGPSMKFELFKDNKLKTNLYLDTFKLIEQFCRTNDIYRFFKNLKGDHKNFIKLI